MTALQGHCRHYSYDVRRNENRCVCAVGCDLSAPGAAKKCMPELSRKGWCPKREEYTEEERREDEERSNKLARDAFTAVAAVLDEKPEPGTTGAIECPICSAKLRWSCALSNGHLHAACETDDCVSFIQ